MNDNKQKIVVITNAGNNIYFGHQYKTYSFKTDKIDKIVDANGAGDSFVGGFLSQLAIDQTQGRSINEHSLREMVQAGHYIASKVILSFGCSFDWL